MTIPPPASNIELSGELRERLAQLDFAVVSYIVANRGTSLDQMLQYIVDSVPIAFEYPVSVCAAITFNGKTIRTSNFRRCTWRLEADIRGTEAVHGKLVVGRFGPIPHGRSAFTDGEKKMMEALATRIGMVIRPKILTDILKSSEKRYRTLVDNALVAVFQTNVKGDVLYINDTCLHMFGFDSREEGMSMVAPLRYRKLQDRNTVVATIEETGKVTNFEVELLKKTGEPIVVLLTASLESGVITGMMMDITEQKRADEALRKSESLYRLLAENVSDVIWTMDMNLNFTYISPSIERLRGIPADRAMRQSLKDLLTPSSYATVLNALEEELAKEYTEATDPARFRVMELEHIRNDGSKGWVEVKVSFLRDGNGRPQGILGVTRDVTHRKEAEKEIGMKSLHLQEVNTALKVLLEQREKDKKELEEKILFNVRKLIMPYVTALRQKHQDDEQRTYLEIIEANLNNIISPFATKLTSLYENFTPLEIRVADLIRDGKTVKEIAHTFGVSESAINLHRQHIRNKLGLNKRKINLRSYLLSLQLTLQ